MKVFTFHWHLFFPPARYGHKAIQYQLFGNYLTLSFGFYRA